MKTLHPVLIRRTVAVLLLPFLTACSGLHVPQKRDPQEIITEGFEQEQVVPVAPKVVPRLTPPAPKGIAKDSEGRRFYISANGLNAREFFLSLVEFSDDNLVVHPEVSGEITIALKDVTVLEVMEIMRDVYGYDFKQTSTGFNVLPGGMRSQIFQVDYLNLSRTGVSKTRISSGQVSQTGTAAEGDGEETSVSGSQIDTQSSTDFWKELEVSLKAIVGSNGGRQVVLHPQANVVLVRALPKELAEVETYLKIIQGNLQRQVILEAKILEVELSDGFQSGINWSQLSKMSDGQSLTLGQVGGGNLLDSGISDIAGQTDTINPLNPSLMDPAITSAFGGAFAAALELKDFTAFIELLETQGDVQVLSSPRISTVNNQKAVIKVGDDEFFVTDVSSDTVTGTTSSSTTDITLTPFFSGIALDVTPQIDPYGMVTLHVHPTVSEVTDQQKVVAVGDKPQVLPLAFSSVRESDSIVRAASGQVVVIGGLMKEGKRRDVAGIPLLGKLPMVGSLFRHTQTSATKSELVILLRPVVVEGLRGWNKIRENTQERFERLGNEADLGRQNDFIGQR